MTEESQGFITRWKRWRPIIRKSTLIIFGVAAAGVVLAILLVILGNRPVTPGKGVAEPAAPQYQNYLSGSGIIEAADGNIQVGTLESGIVTDIFVKEGDHVKRGKPLFKLDDRDLISRLKLEGTELKVARQKVKEAERELDDKRNNYVLAMKVTDSRAISVEEVDRRRNAMRLAEAKLKTAEAQVEQAQARIGMTETEIDRLIVRAPVGGEVLMINIDLGKSPGDSWERSR